MMNEEGILKSDTTVKGDIMPNNQSTVWSEDRLREGLYCHEEAALEAAARQYGRLLRRLAHSITGSEADAEECYNDALLDLWNAIPPDRPAYLMAYVSKLVRRRAVDRVRRKTALRRGGAAYEASMEELAECLADPQGESDLDTMVIRDCLSRFLNRLSEEDRRVFMLRYYQFHSNAEIGKVLGLQESVVVMRLVRLRKKLKKALEAEGISI